MGEQLSEANRALIERTLGVAYSDGVACVTDAELAVLIQAARSEGPHPEQIAENANCPHPESGAYSQAEFDECGQIGERDGYERAVADIDRLTGGDGEFYVSTVPGRGCSDAETMKARIVERFNQRSAPPPPLEGAGRGEDGSSQGLGGHPCGERDGAETERAAALAGDAVGVIRRLVFRLEDLLEIARQWEPDHASAEHRAELFFAREARTAAYEFLSSGRYRQAGTGETFRDQPRLTALSDGALGRQDEVVQPIRDEPISSSKGKALPVEPPLCRLDPPSDRPDWEQIVALFERHGMSAPPWQLRDKLVIMFGWGHYGMALHDAARAARPASDKGEEARPTVLHHHDRHPWAQSGDQPERLWMLVFSDAEQGVMTWRGDDAEKEAREAYARYQVTWTCSLLATVEARPVPGVSREEVATAISGAFEAGCWAIQNNYQPHKDPEFGEAASDYAASVIDTLLSRGEG